MNHRLTFYDEKRAFPSIPHNWGHPSIVKVINFSWKEVEDRADGSESLGNTVGSWDIEFYDFEKSRTRRDDTRLVARVNIFTDGYMAFRDSGFDAMFADLVAEFGNPSPDEVAELAINRLGAVDQTLLFRGTTRVCDACNGAGWVR